GYGMKGADDESRADPTVCSSMCEPRQGWLARRLPACEPALSDDTCGVDHDDDDSDRERVLPRSPGHLFRGAAAGSRPLGRRRRHLLFLARSRAVLRILAVSVAIALNGCAGIQQGPPQQTGIQSPPDVSVAAGLHGAIENTNGGALAGYRNGAYQNFASV